MAELLAEVVELAGDRAVFPGRWEQIAERATEHSSVRRALCELVRDSRGGSVVTGARLRSRLAGLGELVR